jgi:hypothetical protein
LAVWAADVDRNMPFDDDIDEEHEDGKLLLPDPHMEFSKEKPE